MKNSKVQQPFIPTDGLELYYDVKGKKNTDNYKSTLLDMSGKGRHGTLSNFAYEGFSGFTGTTEGGLLLDDVDDKIVRPAISGIKYTSASRNLFIAPIGYSTSTVDGEICTVLNNYTLPNTYEADTRYTISARGKYIAGYAVALKIEYTDGTNSQSIWGLTTFSNMSITSTAGKTVSAIKLIQNTSYQGVYSGAWNTIQLEKNSVATAYTPYIPLPIMTYQMNGNVISYEKDGTVKRTTKDVNGNEVVVSRKGINLVRNGNFTDSTTGWGSYGSASLREMDEDGMMFLPNAQWGGIMAGYNMGLTQNEKYYISAELKTLDTNASLFAINGISNLSTTMHSGSGNYEKLSMCYTHTPLSTIHYVSAQTASTSNFKEIKVRSIQAINLTEAYGAGNEPDLAYIQAHPEEFAWTPNPNDLIETVEIKNNLVGDLENLQGSDFEQHEDGVITYTTEGEEGSVVRVDIDGISDQPLRFRTATGEQVVITEHDQVDTDAIKKVEFAGNSVQLADKYREVSGTSVVIDPTLHDKTIADKLVIGGNTTQYTESSNVVTDGLQMWLSGRNFSNNPATTAWKDLTGVNNGTASGFEYRTNVYADVVSDFTGKIAGSVVENANSFKFSISNTLQTPTGSWNEYTQEPYDRIKTLDGISKEMSRTVNGEIGQQIFSFNVIKAFEKQHGNIPSTDQTTAGKVIWLKDNLVEFVCKWTGYGLCPTGNKAYLKVWLNGNWADWGQNTSSSPALISSNTFYIANGIDANGFIHVLTHTDSSNGVTASTIYTDYVSLTLKSSGASGSDGVGGVNFDGVDDLIVTPEISIPKYQGWTYDSVMSFNGSNWVDFAGAGVGVGAGGALIYHNTSGIAVYQEYYNSTSYIFSSGIMIGTAFQLNTPTRITISYTPIPITNQGTFTFYINGVRMSTLENRNLSPNPSFTAFKFKNVGAVSANARYLNGNIKTALLYNRALSDAEILQNYNAGVTIPIPNIAMPQEVKHVTSGSKVMVHGKNIANIEAPTVKIDYDYVVNSNLLRVYTNRSFSYGTVYRFNLIPNTQYTVRFNLAKGGTASGSYSWILGSDMDTPLSSLVSAMGDTIRTIIVPMDGIVNIEFARVGGAYNDKLGWIDVSNFQLEKGETVTAYEPFKGYQETTIPVTLRSIG